MRLLQLQVGGSPTAVCDLIHHIKNLEWCVTLRDNTPYPLWFTRSKFAVSADAFAAFEDAGLDDLDALGTTGRRFRDTVLSLGGSQHPIEVFTAFRGREPDPAALLRHNGSVGAK